MIQVDWRIFFNIFQMGWFNHQRLAGDHKDFPVFPELVQSTMLKSTNFIRFFWRKKHVGNFDEKESCGLLETRKLSGTIRFREKKKKEKPEN